jgi:hypothetical protein
MHTPSAAVSLNHPNAGRNSCVPGSVRPWLGVWLALSLTCAPAMAADLVVVSLADTGTGTLRNAIADALSGDRIVFAPGLAGTISLDSTLTISRDLIIEGNGNIELDGRDTSRVITITGGQVDLRRLVVRNGFATDGGGISSVGTLRMSNCVVQGNNASARGGGLFIGGGSYSLVDTTIADNFAPNEGGGIVDLSTVPSTITRGRIINNVSSGPGAGIQHASGQTLTINHSTISGNTAATTSPVAGGGIASQSATLNINYSTISGNKSQFAGGVFVTNIGASTKLNLVGSTITGNTAVSDGGGLFVFGAGATLTNSTIVNNLAGTGTGGGFSIQNSSVGTATVIVNNNTIAFNRSGTNGGGIAALSGSLTLKNTLIAGNISGTNANADIQGAFVSEGFNLVQTRGTSTGYVASDLANGTLPQLAALGFNGGPTLTVLPNAGSPAINAIPSSSCAGIALDQRGYTRPANQCDIGALEVGAAPPVGAAPTIAYNPTTGSTVGFTGVTTIGTTGNGTIAATPSGGFGTGAAATTRINTCALGGANAASFAIPAPINLSFVGSTTTPANLGLTCTSQATAQSATLTCNETRGSDAPVLRSWTLNCPGGATVAPTVAYNPTTGSTVGFTGVTTTGTTGNGTIAATPSGGIGTGVAATTTINTCVLGGANAASFAIPAPINLSFVGSTTTPANIGLTCTSQATAQSATLTCNETRGSDTPVLRSWTLNCPMPPVDPVFSNGFE